MSLTLYMDENINGAIIEGLRARGVDCLTCDDDGTRGLRDPALLARASELGRTLFSQDDDMLAIATEWLQAGRAFAGVIYAHQLRITIGQAISDLELMATILSPDEMHNRVEYLPLR